MKTASERVQDGVKWLDDNAPDWYTRINLSSFGIQSPCLCVLGQVFDTDYDDFTGYDWIVQDDFTDFYHPGWTPPTRPDNLHLTVDESRELGFEAYPFPSSQYIDGTYINTSRWRESEYGGLQREWEKVIYERQSASEQEGNITDQSDATGK